eukprot:6247103-Pyramimonas_sp.AAC.1
MDGEVAPSHQAWSSLADRQVQAALLDTAASTPRKRRPSEPQMAPPCSIHATLLQQFVHAVFWFALWNGRNEVGTAAGRYGSEDHAIHC